MNLINKNHFENALKHLYINPLEKCNLRCKICYTKKTGDVLTEQQILDFVDRYKKHQTLETVTFCGGEVFLLPYFINLINKLNAQDIFVQIITNGTVNRLTDISSPNMVNIIVSIDGVEKQHDANRGSGNYKKSLDFLSDAKNKGFHTEIFSIIHQGNIDQIDLFERQIEQHLSYLPSITYHPRKPLAYLTGHPISNIAGEIENFDFLNDQQMLKIMRTRKTFPPINLGCYQIAVTSTGSVFGCCEGTLPIGSTDDSVPDLIDKLRQRVEESELLFSNPNCLGCSQANFICGIKKYLDLIYENN